MYELEVQCFIDKIYKYTKQRSPFPGSILHCETEGTLTFEAIEIDQYFQISYSLN